MKIIIEPRSIVEFASVAGRASLIVCTSLLLPLSAAFGQAEKTSPPAQATPKKTWQPSTKAGTNAGTNIGTSTGTKTANTASVVSTAPTGTAGTEPMVKNRLRQIALGNAAAVREEMPTLLAKYKNDTGVDFLNASVQADPEKANAIFERIVRATPKNSWADDAQWRVVQHHALRKDTSRARTELQNFRRDYPNSEFLLFASEMVKSTVGLPASFAGRTSSTAHGMASPTRLEARSEVRSEASSELARGETAEKNGEKNSDKNGDNASPEKFGSSSSAPTAQPLAEPLAEQRFTLQIGVFASEQNAAVEVQKLIKARMRADVVEKRLGEQIRFAVIVGDYSSRATAEKARGLVQKYTKSMPIIVPKPPAFTIAQ